MVWPLMAARDLAHDGEHLQRVYRWSLRLAEEAPADPDLAGAAALVHDLDDTPKNSPLRARSSERSAELARPLLHDTGYDHADVEKVVTAVALSSWSRSATPIDRLGLVLQEADRLDAIGAIGVARVFATHQAIRSVGCRLFDPDDLCGRSGRVLDDSRTAADHFVVKLLTIAPSLTLPSAQQEGARRHHAMVSYLEELERELHAL